MGQTLPDGHTLRQWEVHVKRMVRHGATSGEILAVMGEANWDEQEARRLIRRIVSKERLHATLLMVGCAVLAAAALIVTIGTFQDAMAHGGEYVIWYGGIICGAIGFFYGLVRLVKVRA
jgi:hypothetical protein